ncbi:Cytochrome P450 [Trinorchestia longiramus]|nr:Cytochrome P450 [Trinorchestia longiramus]
MALENWSSSSGCPCNPDTVDLPAEDTSKWLYRRARNSIRSRHNRQVQLSKMWLEILLFLTLLLMYAVIRDRKPANSPPGPMEIPFFGRIPLMDAKLIQNLRDRYGNIVSCRTGSMRSVMLFDYDTAKEVMARAEFSDRPNWFSAFSLDDQKLGGVGGSNGAHWQHDRRFVIRNLRNLGMGKSYLEEAIHIEAKALVEDLKKYNGEAINYPASFRTVALNIIWQMVASTRYDLCSSEVEAIYRLTNEFQKNFSILPFLPIFIPSLNKLPKWIKDVVFKVNLFDQFLEEMRSVVEKTVDKHLENYDPDNPRDLIDNYIKGMKESEGDKDSFFRRGALYQIISDLFEAGSDTVNNMLKWVAFLLARYPDYSRRMQEQIDEVVSRDRMVSLDDKPRLPLVEAFTVEALRYSSLIVTNVHRVATRDTTIHGYFIPKGTAVSVVNYSIHHDPRYWDDPHKFYPERFLDESGTKYTAPKQGFFVFGSGRRQCVGELLARMELFLFTAGIIQNFDVMPVEGVDLAKQEFSSLGRVRLPLDQKLIYTTRNYLWSLCHGSDTAGNGITVIGIAENGTAGNGTAGNGRAGNDTAGDGRTDNETAGDGRAGKDTAGDGSTGIGTAGNGTAGNGTTENGIAWTSTAGNGSAENGTTGNNTAWNGTAGNGTAGNGTAGNGTAGNGTAGNAKSGYGTAENGTIVNVMITR